MSGLIRLSKMQVLDDQFSSVWCFHVNLGADEKCKIH